MLLPRLITAILGIPLVLAAIYFGGIPYLLFMTAVILIALREFFVLLEHTDIPMPTWVGPLGGIFLLISLYFNGTALGTRAANSATSLILTLLLFGLLLSELFRSTSRANFLRPLLAFAGIIYVAWSLGHLLLLRELRPWGRSYTIFLFVLVWAVDIGAYVVGRRLGRRKLAPEISPGKTIEGALGGTLAGLAGSAALWFFMLRGTWALPEVIFLASLVAIVAQCSDLIESLLKRTFLAKDSSDLLPGHGGVLDRFDSFIFAAPVFYYYIMIFHR